MNRASVLSLALLVPAVLVAAGCKSTSARPRHAVTPIEGTHRCERELVSALTCSAAEPGVIIYGADWCGPCHQAAAFLARRGVSYVERNVETDRDAAIEMSGKLVRAGLSRGGIPVLDVRGSIQVGFDARAVDRALRAM